MSNALNRLRNVRGDLNVQTVVNRATHRKQHLVLSKITVHPGKCCSCAPARGCDRTRETSVYGVSGIQTVALEIANCSATGSMQPRTGSNRRVNGSRPASSESIGDSCLCVTHIQESRIAYMIRIVGEKEMFTDVTQIVHREDGTFPDFSLYAHIHLVRKRCAVGRSNQDVAGGILAVGEGITNVAAITLRAGGFCSLLIKFLQRGGIRQYTPDGRPAVLADGVTI